MPNPACSYSPSYRSPVQRLSSPSTGSLRDHQGTKITSVSAPGAPSSSPQYADAYYSRNQKETGNYRTSVKTYRGR